MPATITLVGENKTEDAFDDAIAELDRLEQKARDAGVSLGDVNAELESRRAREYADAVRRAADELDGTADAARRAKEEAEELADKQERFERFKSSVTAVSTGFLAAGEALEKVGEFAGRTYEAISRLAEQGDKGMAEFKATVDSLNLSFDGLLQGVLSNGEELTAYGKRVNEGFGNLFRGYDILIEAVTGLSAAERKANADRINALSVQKALLDGQYEEAQRRRIESLESLGEVEAKLAELQGGIDAAAAGEQQRTAEQLADFARQIDLLRGRREELAAEQAQAEADAAKAAEERIAKEREAAAERARAAEEAAKRAAELQKRMEDGIRRLAEEERERQQELEEHQLRNEGREEEIHAKRLRWIEEETAAAVAAAATPQAAIEARLEGERKLRQEVHDEKMRLLELERRAEEAAAEAAKQAQEDALKALQGDVTGPEGKGFDREAATQQVLAARLQDARREFFESGEHRGLTPRQLERELELLRRQVTRQTTLDAQGNRLHTDDLAEAQAQLAANAARQAEAQVRQGQAGLQAQRQQLETVDELTRSVEDIAREYASVRQSSRAQADRARAISRSLSGR